MLEFDIKDKTVYQLIAAVGGFAVILIGCLIVMAPFFPAILLATIFTLATWPAFAWLNKKLNHRAGLSAFLMTCALIACFVFPLVIIGTSIADNFSKVYGAVQISLQSTTEQTAQQLADVPYAGKYLEKAWSYLAADKGRLSATLQEYAAPTSQKLIKLGGTIGHGLFDISLGVLMAYFFFRYGHRVAARLDMLIEKFTGARGKHLLNISKNTLIGVVYGILGTALVQGVLATFGFWLANVPGAAFLGLLTFFLSLIPMGPPLIWIPATLWLYAQGDTFWSLFLAIWGVVVISSVDNLLKPYFISRGSDLPLLLVLLGILGGVIAFGFIGVFIGPTILAVAYSLIIEWTSANAQKQ